MYGCLFVPFICDILHRVVSRKISRGSVSFKTAVNETQAFVFVARGLKCKQSDYTWHKSDSILSGQYSEIELNFLFEVKTLKLT